MTKKFISFLSAATHPILQTRNFSISQLSIWYFLVIVLLFLYSFTQVDLNLTLSRASQIHQIQNAFQWIGYFNRPLSTVLYEILLVLLFLFYSFFLYSAHIQKISKKTIWTIILGTSLVLTISYNAFSYDLFNYIFDAKIITYYHQNPYIYKASDFPGDPMLSFMHWVHRTYPYGPVWLAITVPLSFLGLNYFVITSVLFKLLATTSFVGSVYYIGKILKKMIPEQELFGIALFAFNPLVLIESLVSAHIDIVMIFFTLISLYYLLQKKNLLSFILLGLSIGIKFVTVLLLPIITTIYLLQKKHKLFSWKFFCFLAIVCMGIGVIAASVRTNYQPWYFLSVLPFVALAEKKYYYVIPSVIISMFSLFEYVPFLQRGNWDAPVPTILWYMHIVAITISILCVLIYKQLVLKKLRK